jgi:phasin family protein
MSVARTAPAIAFQAYDEMVAFSKDNADAVLQAGANLARGLEGIGTSMVDLAEVVITEGIKTSRRLAGAGSVREILDLHAALALTSFDLMIAEGSRLSEMSVAAVEMAVAPINRRMDAAVDRLLGKAA